MRNNVFITLLFVLFYFASYSQTNYFLNTYSGTYYYPIDVNGSGCYIFNGNILFKTDPDGSVLWAKSFNASRIKRLHNGDFLLVGLASQGVSLLNLNVIRIDSLGNIVWSKNYNSTYTSNSDVCIEELSSHNLIIGFSSTYSTNLTNAWITIDENGVLIGSRSINTDINSFGYPISINEYSNGDLLVIRKGVDLPGPYIQIIRIRPGTDSVLWQMSVSGEQCGFVLKNDVLNFILRQDDPSNPPYGYNSFFKIDQMGQISTRLFGANPSPYNSIGIYNAIDDGFFATKSNRIYKLDSLFNLEWQKEVSNSLIPGFYPISVFNSSDHSIYTFFDTPISPNLFHLIKADSLCNSACGIDSSSAETWEPLFTAPPIYDTLNIIIDSFPVLESNFVGTSTNVAITRNVICSTALEETDTELLSFEVFPNPAVDHLTISKKSSAGYLDQFNVSVFNAQGKLVLQKEKLNSSTQLDLKNLNNGVYLILITTEKGNKSYKIMKN